ncbi:hypothetical protein N869_07145, partial [Cellulomonas bogoriensis 69B4 = DSM 16987]
AAAAPAGGWRCEATAPSVTTCRTEGVPAGGASELDARIIVTDPDLDGTVEVQVDVRTWTERDPASPVVATLTTRVSSTPARMEVQAPATVVLSGDPDARHTRTVRVDVRNTGGTTRPDARLTLEVPAALDGLTVRPAAGSPWSCPTLSPGTRTCTVDVLPRGASVPLDLELAAPRLDLGADRPLHDLDVSGTLTARTVHSTATTEVRLVSAPGRLLVPDPEPLTVEAAIDGPRTGDLVVPVRNTGGTTVPVTVHLDLPELPAGATLAVADGPWVCADGTCTLPALAPATTERLTLTVGLPALDLTDDAPFVGPPVTTPVGVRVDGARDVQVPLTLQPASAPPLLTVETNPGGPGAPVDLTLRVTNPGGSTLTGLTLQVALPQGISLTPGLRWQQCGTGTWCTAVGPVVGGGSAQAPVRVTVPPGTANRTVVLTLRDGDGSLVARTEHDLAVTAVAELRATSTLDREVLVGAEPAVATTLVANDGQAPADQVRVAVTLPSGVLTGVAGCESLEDGTTVCEQSITVAPEDQTEVTVPFTGAVVDADLAAAVAVEVEHDGEVVLAAAHPLRLVSAPADLTVHAPELLHVERDVPATVTYLVHNQGGTTAPGATVVLRLPPGVFWESGGGNGWSCQAPTGSNADVPCTTGAPLAPDAGAELQVRFVAQGNADGRVMSATLAPSAHPAVVTTVRVAPLPACEPPWRPWAFYRSGDLVSYEGSNYRAHGVIGGLTAPGTGYAWTQISACA